MSAFLIYCKKEEILWRAKDRNFADGAMQTSKNMNETARLQLIIAKQQAQIERLKKGYTVKGVGADRIYVTTNDMITKSSKH